MWIRSEDGKLFNLDGAYSVSADERGGQFVVVAECVPNDVRSFNLTGRLSGEAASAILDEIENALSEGRALLNLQRAK